MRSAWLLASALTVLSTAATARAYEDVLTLDVELGAAFSLSPDFMSPCCGPLFGIANSIGLGDKFALRGRIEYAWLPSGGDDVHAAIVGAELFYLIDVVQFVPFFGLGLDVFAGGPAPFDEPALGFGGHAILGFDYLVSREIALGLDVRPHLFFNAASDIDIEPLLLTANLRFSYRIEI
jgi:hypothetical protein